MASLETLLGDIDQASINQALAKEYSDHITDNERRLEQVLEFKARLYESLVGGMLTKEEYASYKAKYTKQAEDIKESIRVLKEKLTDVLENRSERNRWISQFTQFATLETLEGAEVWLDVSLRDHETVYPSAGSAHSGVALSCEELEMLARPAGWCDVCRDPEG